MGARSAKADAGIGVSAVISTVIHLAVFLLLYWWGVLFPSNMKQQETYYVDVVNLPVANPRAGSPVQKGNDREAPAPPVQEKSMTAPAPSKAVAKNAKKPADPDPVAKQLAKLQNKADAQREAAVLERMRQKVAASGTGRAGMPGATGTEAGSDYAAYIQSRLKDAFYITIDHAGGNPEVRVKLTIGTNGRIAAQKVENSTRDHRFELSVLRAIELAEKQFRPPPSGKPFTGVFVFRPQGITNKK